MANDWDETTITWNNAPLAMEKYSQAWVEPIIAFSGWSGVERRWDVGYGVEQAYSLGQALRLVLYEADGAYHSGKYYVSSDINDWNEVGRLTLIVTCGDP